MTPQYEPPIPGRIYINTVDLIRSKHYQITNIPAFYIPKTVHITDSLGEIVDPPYTPEPHELCSQALTIPFIVDMFFNDIPFKYRNPDDLYDVAYHLNNYLEWVKTFNTIPADHVEFVMKAKKYLPYLQDRCNRLTALRKAEAPAPKAQNVTLGSILYKTVTE